jgi:hypothetical protein
MLTLIRLADSNFLSFLHQGNLQAKIYHYQSGSIHIYYVLGIESIYFTTKTLVFTAQELIMPTKIYAPQSFDVMDVMSVDFVDEKNYSLSFLIYKVINKKDDWN